MMAGTAVDTFHRPRATEEAAQVVPLASPELGENFSEYL